jgi:hypothetical protein
MNENISIVVTAIAALVGDGASRSRYSGPSVSILYDDVFIGPVLAKGCCRSLFNGKRNNLTRGVIYLMAIS